jgi:hypothetical protein
MEPQQEEFPPQVNSGKKVFLLIILGVAIVLILGMSFIYITFSKRPIVSQIDATLYSQKILAVSEDISNPQLIYVSEDGNHTIYSGMTATGTVVVVDGHRSENYEYITDLSVNKEANSVVFVGNRLGKFFVVKGVTEDRPYNAIIGKPIINNDGLSNLYLAIKGEKEVLVVNGVEKKVYSSILGATRNSAGKIVSYQIIDPIINLTGEKAAFVIAKGNKPFIALYDFKKDVVEELKEYVSTGDTLSSQVGFEIKNKSRSELAFENTFPSSTSNGDPIFAFDGPSGQILYVYAFLNQDKLTEQQKKDLNEETFYAYAQNRIVFPDGQEIVADKLINPVFSKDGTYLTVGTLKNKDISREVYIYNNGHIQATRQKEGYVIPLSSLTLNSQTYPSDEKGPIKGMPVIAEQSATFTGDVNKITFSLDFGNKPNSKALFVVYLDNRIIGSIYEGDVTSGIHSYTFRFPTQKSGQHLFKYHLEPLNKAVRAEINFKDLKVGFEKN